MTPQRENQVRFWASPVMLIVFFFMIILKLGCLHFTDIESHNNTDYRSGLIKATRGKIYDRNSSVVAISEPGYKVFFDTCVDIKEGQDLKATCRRVAELTGKSYDEIHTSYTTQTNRGYVVQGKTFDSSAVDLWTNKTLYIRGVGLDPIERRAYPQGRLFSHILGFVSGDDFVGRNGGIEQRYEEYLRGVDGYIVGKKANGGREIRERRKFDVKTIDGSDIYLTIDKNLQYIAHKALAEAVKEWNAEGGRVIIQKVDTGEILAMVSLPDFDPNDLTGYVAEMGQNRNVSHIYEPGSTMKIVTVSAAVNSGTIKTNDTYHVESRVWNYGGRKLSDHVSGKLDIATIIAKSSNIGSAKIALDMGNKVFESYLRDFGFGASTGIDLPGEGTGILTPSDKWEKVRPTRVAIGQGIAVTPIQMINAYTTIANGGKRMRPYVMKRVVSATGEVLVENEPRVLSTPISEETAAQMRQLLKGVVLPGGTARRARVDGYTVAGKTGTAQMINPAGGYYEKKFWGSFIGFLPADKPEITILVVMDDAKKSGVSQHGGVCAAPVFSQIAGEAAQYLGITPDK